MGPGPRSSHRRDGTAQAGPHVSRPVTPPYQLGRLPSGLRPEDLNLVLVTLDTTRADRLGCYGYSEIQTPNLDALASHGALFEQAHASAPLTLPSHASLFTAKQPPAHGVRDNGGFFLAESEETLAEVLREEGLATGGFVSAYVLDSRWGIAQGFDSYFDEFDLSRFKAVSMGDIQRRGDETLERALSWIRDQAGRRFFAWLHFYDPHSPYEPPEPFASQYAGRPYLGEIAYTDALVGRLLGELSSQGLLGRTVIVVTGDHGESLGEHSESGHAFFVYGVTTHVPLILSGPYSGLAGRRIPQVVRAIDILPTILELLGVGRPAPGLGISLIPLLRAGAPARPPAYSESYYPRFHFGWSDLRALRTDRYRFIEAPRPELYELGTDPEEKVNLASAHVHLHVAPQRPPVSSVTVPLNAYASSGQLDEALAMYRKTLSLKPDHDWAVVGMADAYVDLGRIEEAILPFIEQSFDTTFQAGGPFIKDKLWYFASAQYLNDQTSVGGAPGSGCRAGTCPSEGSDNENVTYRLAETLMDAGRLDEAGATFRRVLEIWPRRASAAVGLAAVALKRLDPDAARAQIQRALAIDPSARNAHYNLALALEAQGDAAGAMAAYRREISLREQASSASQASKARFNLARLLGQTGDRQGQVRELQAALRDNPDFHLGRYFLAKALLDAADLAGAEEQARRALAMAPDHYYAPLGHYVLADIFNRQGRQAEAREEARQGRILESRDLPRPPS